MSDETRYPRVLVVGQSFDRTSGGGITLSNLFQGWPRASLANVVLPDANVEWDVCERFYRLGTDEVGWVWPLSLVPRTETPSSGPIEPPSSPCPGGPQRPAREDRGRARGLFESVLDWTGAQDLLRPTKVSRPLLEWVRAFGPDLIYSQLSDLPMIGLVADLAARTETPHALHFMDDWPRTAYRTGVFAPIAHRRMERGLASLVGTASALLAISEDMAAEYGERYGRPFTATHNPVDLEQWDALAAAHPHVLEGAGSETLSIVYAGRIGRANTDSLLDVAKAVGRLCAAGTSVRLHVYTNESGSAEAAAMREHAGVVVSPGVAYEEVPGLLAAADVLLLPLDFGGRALDFARLSMPTKVSEYMAAGRAVLTYAPTGTAVARYARGGTWSLAVIERDAGALEEAIRTLRDDAGLRARMGETSRAIAIERHDARAVRARFAAALARAGGVSS